MPQYEIELSVAGYLHLQFTDQVTVEEKLGHFHVGR